MNTDKQTIDNPKLNMRVVDSDDNRGTIIKIYDNHNILIKYDNGGQGLYCIVKDCPEYEGELFELKDEV